MCSNAKKPSHYAAPCGIPTNRTACGIGGICAYSGTFYLMAQSHAVHAIHYRDNIMINTNDWRDDAIVQNTATQIPERPPINLHFIVRKFPLAYISMNQHCQRGDAKHGQPAAPLASEYRGAAYSLGKMERHILQYEIAPDGADAQYHINASIWHLMNILENAVKLSVGDLPYPACVGHLLYDKQ